MLMKFVENDSQHEKTAAKFDETTIRTNNQELKNLVSNIFNFMKQILVHNINRILKMTTITSGVKDVDINITFGIATLNKRSIRNSSKDWVVTISAIQSIIAGTAAAIPETRESLKC